MYVYVQYAPAMGYRNPAPLMKKDRWQKRGEEKKDITGTKGDSFHFHEGSAFRNSLAICRRFVAATTTTTTAEAICAALVAVGISWSPDGVKQREKGEMGAWVGN